MISLEKYGDTTYVDWSKSTPNSLSNGIVIELRWTFIEMRERRNFFRTKYDKLAHFMKSIFIGDEDLDLGIYYEMKDGTKSLYNSTNVVEPRICRRSKGVLPNSRMFGIRATIVELQKRQARESM